MLVDCSVVQPTTSTIGCLRREKQGTWFINTVFVFRYEMYCEASEVRCMELTWTFLFISKNKAWSQSRSFIYLYDEGQFLRQVFLLSSYAAWWQRYNCITNKSRILEELIFIFNFSSLLNRAPSPPTMDEDEETVYRK